MSFRQTYLNRRTGITIGSWANLAEISLLVELIDEVRADAILANFGYFQLAQKEIAIAPERITSVRRFSMARMLVVECI